MNMRYTDGHINLDLSRWYDYGRWYESWEEKHVV